MVLTLIYQSVEHHLWPATNPIWLTALTTLAISLPLLTLLCITTVNIKKTLKYIIPFSIILSISGAYVGSQQVPKALFDNDNILIIFCFTALIASFKALIYIQQYIDDRNIEYEELFKRSWQNFIIFVGSWLFIGIFWGILNLGAELFSILEIDFFQKLLRKDWFVIPVLTLAFGSAIIMFRNTIHTIDHILILLQTLIKFILPMLTIVSLGFLITLPFSGLEALWKIGSGSFLVMWLQALTLFFVNAVYQDRVAHRPYQPLLHRLIFIGVAILPIYSLISAYGLWLRIAQYGLTPDRCWAILVWSLLSCFSFGYLYGIWRKRDTWLETLSSVNIIMGIIILVLMLLVNSPLLNFQYLSAESQLSRLTAGKISYNDFDYDYFKRSLGRQGYLAMQQLKQKLAKTSPDHVLIIDRMYTNHPTKNDEDDGSEFEKLLIYWPDQASFPQDLIKHLYTVETQKKSDNYREKNYYLLFQDLNSDGDPEYIVITESNYYTYGAIWFKENGVWNSHHMSAHNPEKNRHLKKHIEDGDIKIVEPRWHHLRVGNVEFRSQKN